MHHFAGSLVNSLVNCAVVRRGHNKVANKLILFHLKIQTQLVKGQIAACVSQGNNLKDLLYKIMTDLTRPIEVTI